ncbi:flagellar motor protein MotB [Rhodospirillum rubrum]|uniref:Motility protein B-like N-terminal domain-containing protein n=1 Tax=Rhodospirillum rubrum (strain ATCC 11170 / ATH 1.1.1 / DSM 467 / LMG 4362 / NCIMB 8255 / S1) TaxID=269796 RepID=Q2RQG5_RHORT|nr:flagellar motor protein MotB [Rhodospirillum rubrum]ABC23630.1 hypothetical protein Rru_A2833 [Rhodospirillum rubrum ATCC 11170]AEO49368.1 hypothetical protein F11_14530 [Rhodospirillum rubrum F11]MBK5955307.1 hypothetical protein [Rhodospirillum rubrum]QXG79591.1 hypothetical protein KUL73_14600 [Rhodospirillum rubrum]HAP98646.1 hypothetical protein [Rhodospirillum rubrum]
MNGPDYRAVDLMAVSAGSSQGSNAAANLWLVTFSDLVLLLLAFFVMLFAMSPMGGQERGGAVPLRAEAPLATESKPPEESRPATVPPRGAATEYLAVVLRDGLDRVRALRDTKVVLSGDQVLLRPPVALFGEGGDASALSELAGFLDRLDNRVILVVFRKEQSGGDPWRGALAEAVDAANRLREAGFGRQLTAQARLVSSAASEGPALLVLGEGVRP